MKPGHQKRPELIRSICKNIAIISFNPWRLVFVMHDMDNLKAWHFRYL